MEENQNLKNVLKKLYEIREFFDNNDLSGIYLSNLPSQFFETFDECINDIQKEIKI